MRIVSLLPAATEIVAEVGAADRLVGRSHECDWPAAVRALPACTASAVRVEGTSAAIHAAVADALRDALAIYRVDVERLAALAPDLIVTQDRCGVCAVTPADLARDAGARLGTGVRILSLRPSTLDDVLDDHVRVGDAIGDPAAGRAARTRLAARVDARTVPRGGRRPRVVVLEWIDPPMAGGHWTPELVARAGGDEVLGRAGAPSRVVTWAEVAAAAPEVLLVAPCGFDAARAWAERAALLAAPGFAALPAVRAGRAFVLDGNAWVNRPGPRLVETLEVFAACLAGVPERAPGFGDRIRRLG